MQPLSKKQVNQKHYKLLCTNRCKTAVLRLKKNERTNDQLSVITYDSNQRLNEVSLNSC